MSVRVWLEWSTLLNFAVPKAQYSVSEKAGNLQAFEISPACENGHRSEKNQHVWFSKNTWKMPHLFAQKHFLFPMWKHRGVIFQLAWRGWLCAIDTISNNPAPFRIPYSDHFVAWLIPWVHSFAESKHIWNVFIIRSINRRAGSAALNQLNNVTENSTPPRLVHHFLFCPVSLAASHASFN